MDSRLTHAPHLRPMPLGHSSGRNIRLGEGIVSHTTSGIVCGPRCALTSDGNIVCSYMLQSALGQNDFCPVLARSFDGGITWHDEGPIWPSQRDKYSIFGSISKAANGDSYFFGTRTPIDKPNESFWCDALQGLKPNELVWARSSDAAHEWSDLEVIPMPFPGAAEAAGAMCIARDGTLHACYCPYNTFDPQLVVPRNQVVLLSRSPSEKSWRHTAMMQFADELTTAAEAWIVELADGRLLGACWSLNQRDGSDFANAYAISHDGGRTWSPTQSTGIFGQACSLMPLEDGGALFVYNQRRHGRIGVWLAKVRPTEQDFGIQWSEIVWEAPDMPRGNSHSDWCQFTFGEPAAVVLPEGVILVVLWNVQQSMSSIRYVRIQSANPAQVVDGHSSPLIRNADAHSAS